MAYIVTSYLRLLTYCIHKLVTLLHVILYSVIFQGVCCPQIFWKISVYLLIRVSLPTAQFSDRSISAFSLSLSVYPFQFIPFSLPLSVYPFQFIPFSLSLSVYPLQFIPFSLSLSVYPFQFIPFSLSLSCFTSSQPHNIRSAVCSPVLQAHIELSIILYLYRYDLILPWPVTIIVRFGGHINFQFLICLLLQGNTVS